MVASCMTLSGSAFRKTLPYSISVLFVVAVELVPHLWDSTSSKYYRLFWTLLTVLVVLTVLLQMLAFSLEAHTKNPFRVFRPFRIEILTVIRLSSSSNAIGQSNPSATASANKNEKKSIV
jgi:Na+/H+-dicarboxylate symporter